MASLCSSGLSLFSHKCWFFTPQAYHSGDSGFLKLYHQNKSLNFPAAVGFQTLLSLSFFATFSTTQTHLALIYKNSIILHFLFFLKSSQSPHGNWDENDFPAPCSRTEQWHSLALGKPRSFHKMLFFGELKCKQLWDEFFLPFSAEWKHGSEQGTRCWLCASNKGLLEAHNGFVIILFITLRQLAGTGVFLMSLEEMIRRIISSSVRSQEREQGSADSETSSCGMVQPQKAESVGNTGNSRGFGVKYQSWGCQVVLDSWRQNSLGLIFSPCGNSPCSSSSWAGSWWSSECAGKFLALKIEAAQVLLPKFFCPDSAGWVPRLSLKAEQQKHPTCSRKFENG